MPRPHKLVSVHGIPKTPRWEFVDSIENMERMRRIEEVDREQGLYRGENQQEGVRRGVDVHQSPVDDYMRSKGKEFDEFLRTSPNKKEINYYVNKKFGEMLKEVPDKSWAYNTMELFTRKQMRMENIARMKQLDIDEERASEMHKQLYLQQREIDRRAGSIESKEPVDEIAELMQEAMDEKDLEGDLQVIDDPDADDAAREWAEIDLAEGVVDVGGESSFERLFREHAAEGEGIGLAPVDGIKPPAMDIKAILDAVRAIAIHKLGLIAAGRAAAAGGIDAGAVALIDGVIDEVRRAAVVPGRLGFDGGGGIPPIGGAGPPPAGGGGGFANEILRVILRIVGFGSAGITTGGVRNAILAASYEPMMKFLDKSLSSLASRIVAYTQYQNQEFLLRDVKVDPVVGELRRSPVASSEARSIVAKIEKEYEKTAEVTVSDEDFIKLLRSGILDRSIQQAKHLLKQSSVGVKDVIRQWVNNLVGGNENAMGQMEWWDTTTNISPLYKTKMLELGTEDLLDDIGSRDSVVLISSLKEAGVTDESIKKSHVVTGSMEDGYVDLALNAIEKSDGYIKSAEQLIGNANALGHLVGIEVPPAALAALSAVKAMKRTIPVERIMDTYFRSSEGPKQISYKPKTGVTPIAFENSLRETAYNEKRVTSDYTRLKAEKTMREAPINPELIEQQRQYDRQVMREQSGNQQTRPDEGAGKEKSWLEAFGDLIKPNAFPEEEERKEEEYKQRLFGKDKARWDEEFKNFMEGGRSALGSGFEEHRFTELTTYGLDSGPHLPPRMKYSDNQVAPAPAPKPPSAPVFQSVYDTAKNLYQYVTQDEEEEEVEEPRPKRARVDGNGGESETPEGEKIALPPNVPRRRITARTLQGDRNQTRI